MEAGGRKKKGNNKYMTSKWEDGRKINGEENGKNKAHLWTSNAALSCIS